MPPLLRISPDTVTLSRDGLLPESDLDGYARISIYGDDFDDALIALRLTDPDGNVAVQYVHGPSFTAQQLIVHDGQGRVDALDARPRRHKRRAPLATATFTAVSP